MGATMVNEAGVGQIVQIGTAVETDEALPITALTVGDAIRASEEIAEDAKDSIIDFLGDRLQDFIEHLHGRYMELPQAIQDNLDIITEIVKEVLKLY